MSQPGTARFEVGGTTPTVLPVRIAAAVGLMLSDSLAPAKRRTA